MTLFFSVQLRKPQVEKLRRERINSSIEQLKSLLGPEFLKQQPDSKLEKADILEMTVCFLRRLQQQHQAVDSAAVNQGYSRCVQEVVHFLSKEEVKTQTQRRLLDNFNKVQCSSAQDLRQTDFCPLNSNVQTRMKFLNQQPDSKLEKADILEMTVCFLRRLQQQHQAVDSAAVDQGYSRCVQEVVHFLSKEEVKTQTQRRLLDSFNKVQCSSAQDLRQTHFCPLSSNVQTRMSKEKCPVSSALWRPW
ncbi:hypothetical protein Q8A73_006006 [Channa argus]|nr:hypothetical protein Q8A73_006006 [Channa argus]